MKKLSSIFTLFVLVGHLVIILTGCTLLTHVKMDPQSINKTLVTNQQKQPKLIVQLNHANPITAMALSSDGRLLVTASWDKTLRLWDATSGQELRRFEGYKGVIKAVALSPNSELLLAGGEDGYARLWNTNTGTEILQLTNHTKKSQPWLFLQTENCYLPVVRI